MHALIIEKDTWVVFMIEDALRDSGYTSFDVAASCEDALELARKRCPSLITSDVRLGASCGIETVRRICSDGYIPVIFVTSTGWEVHDKHPNLTVVQKPFAPGDLTAALSKAMECSAPFS